VAGELEEEAEGRLRLVEQPVDGGQGGFSARGQPHAASRALEERHTEVLFHTPDLLADGGRGLVQPARGSSHRPCANHGENILQGRDEGGIHDEVILN
jgi:hypothetical protein